MKKYSKMGLKIGLVISLLMTVLLAISYTDFFTSIGIKSSILLVVLIPYLVPFSIVMLLLDNSSCSLKYATNCTGEIIAAMIASIMFFTILGFLIGLIIDKVKSKKVGDPTGVSPLL